MTTRADAPFQPGYPMPLCYTAEQAAYLLNMSYEKVLALIKSDMIGYLPNGRKQYLIPHKAVEEFIDKNTVPASK